MVTSHFHNALHKYLDAHKALLSQWNEEQLTDNETAVINRQYPFSKSFDDLLSDVQMWVDETCNRFPYLIPATFATQSSRTVNGYYYESERWNGFYMPLLERSAVEILMQYDKNIAIDANDNVYLEGENDTIAPIEIEGKQLYHFNNGWTWTKIEQPTGINTIEDAKQFIKECVDYVGLSFHPDKMFSEYIDSRTNETLYSDQAVIEANDKLQDCLIEFEVAGQDVYQYALSLL